MMWRSMPELQRTYRGSATRPEDDHRAGPERAILIASLPRAGEEEDDRLDELRELLRTAGAEVVETLVQHRERPDPAHLPRAGAAGGAGRARERGEARPGGRGGRAQPRASSAAGGPAQDPGGRPHGRDPRHLRPARPLGRGQAPGRAGPARVLLRPPGGPLAAPRAAGRRRRHARPGRDASSSPTGACVRARMAACARRLRDVARSRERQRDRRVALGPAPGRARRLHQRRQVEPDERADRRRRDASTTRCSRPSTPRRGPSSTTGTRLLLSDTVGFIRRLPHQLVEAFRPPSRRPARPT